MDSTDVIVRQAKAAAAGGAAGLRIAGMEAVRSVANATDIPIIGITKRDLEKSQVRITPTVDDAVSLVEAGASIVAYDATDRARPCRTSEIAAAIREGGAIAMADCAVYEDGARAVLEGAAVLATTLSGYTAGGLGEDALPDFSLVRALAKLGAFVIAEGRIRTPKQASEAVTAGADAVVVGSAITRIEVITEWYASAIAGNSIDDQKKAVDRNS